MASNTLVEAASNSESCVPKIMEPLHPKGLRAFPPEIRKPIFVAAFTEKSGRVVKDRSVPSLLQALEGFDQELHEEALAAFYEVATVIFPGRSDITQFHGPISDTEQPLIQNLQINFFAGMGSLSERDTHSYYPPLYPSIQFITVSQIFCRLSNVHSLTINMSTLKHEGLRRTLDFKELIKTVIGKFSNLRKISVMFEGERSNFYFYNEDGTRPSWQTCIPHSGVVEFERGAVSVIQQALGVNLKMDHVHPVSDDPFTPVVLPAGLQNLSPTHQLVGGVLLEGGAPGSRVCFCPQFTDSVALPPGTTWFWEAEKGKSLAWNEDKIQPDWSGFIVWDGKPGETIRWTERLVTRDAAGLVYFEQQPGMEDQEKA